MTIELRTLTEADADDAFVVEAAAFSNPISPADRDQTMATIEWDRMIGAYDGSQLCGIVGDYGVDLTLPGLLTVPTAGVTAVGVLPTHRRRGVLTALMTRQMDEIVARGVSVAVLTASEATIYGRFGYGVASVSRSIEVQRARSAFVEPVGAGLPLRMLTRDEAIARAPEWFDAARITRPGEISRPATWWRFVFGEHETWKGGGDQFVVACEPDDGRPGGYATYRVTRDEATGRVTLVVRDLIAAEPDVATALWRFVLDVDLVDVVRADVAVDETLRGRLADWRALTLADERDFLWARVLDPVGVLSSRRYGVEDELVLAVVDPFRPANSGSYRVGGGPAGADVAPTSAPADLTMGISELGSLHLGGFAPTWLARAGRIESRTSEMLARADRFFASPDGLQPHCSTGF
jgi:predicted acetyltransferase